MYKMQIFHSILEIVSLETEISDTDILTSSVTFTEIVDARYLLVRFLSEEGIYPTQIATLTGFSKRTVNRILTLFDARKEQSRMMQINMGKIKSRIGQISDTWTTYILHRPLNQS